MSQAKNPQVVSFEASEVMATNYIAVKADTGANQVGIGDAGTDNLIGISQDTVATANTSVSVAINGIAKAKVGTGGVSKYDKLTAESGGKLVTTTTSGHKVVGLAMEAGDANDIIPVLLTPGKIVD